MTQPLEKSTMGAYFSDLYQACQQENTALLTQFSLLAKEADHLLLDEELENLSNHLLLNQQQFSKLQKDSRKLDDFLLFEDEKVVFDWYQELRVTLQTTAERQQKVLALVTLKETEFAWRAQEKTAVLNSLQHYDALDNQLQKLCREMDLALALVQNQLEQGLNRQQNIQNTMAINTKMVCFTMASLVLGKRFPSVMVAAQLLFTNALVANILKTMINPTLIPLRYDEVLKNYQREMAGILDQSQQVAGRLARGLRNLEALEHEFDEKFTAYLSMTEFRHMQILLWQLKSNMQQKLQQMSSLQHTVEVRLKEANGKVKVKEHK